MAYYGLGPVRPPEDRKRVLWWYGIAVWNWIVCAGTFWWYGHVETLSWVGLALSVAYAYILETK